MALLSSVIGCMLVVVVVNGAAAVYASWLGVNAGRTVRFVATRALRSALSRRVRLIRIMR